MDKLCLVFLTDTCTAQQCVRNIYIRQKYFAEAKLCKLWALQVSWLFKAFKMSKFQMMFGINLFSCTFTCWSLILQGSLFPSLAFALRWPKFMWHLIILSITSATGQLFIFHTIATYGPLVFTIIMTTRQVASIFLSAMFFGHKFTAQGWMGVAIVAAALFAKVYFSHLARKAKKQAAALAAKS